MSIPEMNFKNTPSKEKPQRRINWCLLVLKSVLCILGPMSIPTIVYIMEGWTALFWWTLGFGFLVSLLLLTIDLQKVKGVIKLLKANHFDGSHGRKAPHVPFLYDIKAFLAPSHHKIKEFHVPSKRRVLHVPSSYKNLSPLERDIALKNGPPLKNISDWFLELHSTPSPTSVEIPISLDSSSMSGDSGVSSPQLPMSFSPTISRVISATPFPIIPVRKELKAPKVPLPKGLFGSHEYTSFYPLRLNDASDSCFECENISHLRSDFAQNNSFNSPVNHFSEELDETLSETSPIFEEVGSHNSLFLPENLDVSAQKPTTFSPSQRRVISAASVVFSPLRNEFFDSKVHLPLDLFESQRDTLPCLQDQNDDKFDEPQPTTFPPIAETLTCCSQSMSGELEVSAQLPTLPSKRRVISATSSFFSPLRNEEKDAKVQIPKELFGSHKHASSHSPELNDNWFNEPPSTQSTISKTPMSCYNQSTSGEPDVPAQEPRTISSSKRRVISAKSIFFSPFRNEEKDPKAPVSRELFGSHGFATSHPQELYKDWFDELQSPTSPIIAKTPISGNIHSMYGEFDTSAQQTMTSPPSKRWAISATSISFSPLGSEVQDPKVPNARKFFGSHAPSPQELNEDGFDDPQSTTSPTIVGTPISFDSPSTSEIPTEKPATLTPTKRRMISATSISLSPLANEVKTPKLTVPKALFGFHGSASSRPRVLKDASYLSTILESTESSEKLMIL